jgi:hypothetical protein
MKNSGLKPPSVSTGKAGDVEIIDNSSAPFEESSLLSYSSRWLNAVSTQ